MTNNNKSSSTANHLEFNQKLMRTLPDDRRLSWYDEMWPYIITLLKDYEKQTIATDKLVEKLEVIL